MKNKYELVILKDAPNWVYRIESTEKNIAGIGIHIATLNPNPNLAPEKMGKIMACAPEMYDLLKRLAHYFDGLEGPFSDRKKEILDIISHIDTEKS